MLAEPRYRQKYTTNHGGKDWLDDKSKLGQKMLERMGWAEGRGLGANEDGRLNCIKVTQKKDKKGVGMTNQHADNWIENQDDFNSLLAELAASHGDSNSQMTPADDSDVPTPQSLEERSRDSKKRVHYSKFTRGKDLSSYKSHDLSCIFGSRKKRKVDEHNEAEEDEEKFVKSTTSVADYFAQKMQALKTARKMEDVVTARETHGAITTEPMEEDADSNEQHLDGTVAEIAPKKKTKKRQRDANAQIDVASSYVEKEVEEEQQCDESQEQIKKKKKKCKKSDEPEELSLNKGADTETVHNKKQSCGTVETSDLPGKKKKRKKNKTKSNMSELCEMSTLSGDRSRAGDEDQPKDEGAGDIVDEGTAVSKKNRRKGLSKEGGIEEALPLGNGPEERRQKQKRKKDKIDADEILNPASDVSPATEEDKPTNQRGEDTHLETKEEKKKRKKSKKTASAADVSEADASSSVVLNDKVSEEKQSIEDDNAKTSEASVVETKKEKKREKKAAISSCNEKEESGQASLIEGGGCGAPSCEKVAVKKRKNVKVDEHVAPSKKKKGKVSKASALKRQTNHVTSKPSRRNDGTLSKNVNVLEKRQHKKALLRILAKMDSSCGYTGSNLGDISGYPSN